MEILLRNIPNDYLYKKHYLDKHSSEIETLILGSSHTYYGVNPDFFSTKTFNASHISQSLEFDFAILKKYEQNFNNLKTIILPVSYFTYFSNLENGSESWRVKNYIIYYEIDTDNSFKESNEVLSNQFNKNINRLVSYYLYGNSTLTCSKLGWGTKYNSKFARNLFETGEIAAKRHTKIDQSPDNYQAIVNENLLILNSIVKWSNERNIKVLLLTTPAFNSYRQNLNIDQLNFTVSVSNEIASKYDNCFYLNMIGDPNFIERDFYDADHMSEIGAEKLSILLNDRISGYK